MAVGNEHPYYVCNLGTYLNTYIVLVPAAGKPEYPTWSVLIEGRDHKKNPILVPLGILDLP